MTNAKRPIGPSEAALCARVAVLPLSALRSIFMSHDGAGRFETTHWSIVLAARGDDSSAARHALSTLCESYWYPLYAYARREGYQPDDARDLTQSFLVSLLERDDLRRVAPDKGRFRSFLLAALRHFLLNDVARRRTKKRGGEARFVPLESERAEDRYRLEPADVDTPEVLFDRRWALAVLDRVLARLQSDWHRAGKAREFGLLKDSLMGEFVEGGYEALAVRLESTEGAVKVTVHRMRKQFQRLLREEIANTVSNEDDVEDEIRYLFRSLRG